jgi:hypothetical protein
MRTLFPFLAAICVVGAGAMAVFTGCETESATSSLITVSPESARLAYGESQTFTAQGGRSYSWSLSSSSYGALSSRSGESVTYTSTYSGGSTNPVVSLTLTGTLGASGTTDTWFAEATIMHTGSSADLYISPASGVELENEETQVYTASGGVGSYTWTVSDSTLAWLSRASGDWTELTSKFVPSGTNTTKTEFLTVKSGDQTYTISVKLK